MLDGNIYPHPGPEISHSNFLSRLTFWPATRLVFSCCNSKKKHEKFENSATAGHINHARDLWRFNDIEAFQVWQRFKPYWKEEITQPEYDFFQVFLTSHPHPNLRSQKICFSVCWFSPLVRRYSVLFAVPFGLHSSRPTCFNFSTYCFPSLSPC